ncbi:MAG TPA: glycosyltransferase family 39 protein [Gemmatimonadaceae bacterium]|nr:glycosyltransferase family 39 protein [Gemmatimonadaceae bacterium]
MSEVVDARRATRSRLRWEFAAVALLMAIAAALRFYQLDQYPLGVHQDELSNMYDGYSIATTGADRFGTPHPAIVRAFGENDYRPAMYAWLAAVPMSLSGFSIIAGRLPAAILGIASLWFLYLLAKSAGGSTYGLLALLLGVLSPLHIQYSRVAHEGAMLPAFFAILILFLWYRGARTGFPLGSTALLGFVVGLSANAYQATKLTAFLFFLCIAVDMMRRQGKRGRAALLILAVTAFIGALPQIIVLASEQQHFFARAKVLSVHAGNPISYASQVLWNYWLNLAPRYLFIPRDYSDLTVARLLPPEVLFFYAGIFTLALLNFGRRPEPKWYIYPALAIVILPAALTTGNPNTLRASGMATLTPLVSAAGVIWLGRRFFSQPRLRRIYYLTSVALLVASAAAITWRYSRSVHFREAYFQNFLIQLDKAVGRRQKNFDAVLIENYGSERHLYTAAFAGMTPAQFQRAPKIIYSDGMDRFRRLGKYYFVWPSTLQKTADSVSHRDARILLVARRPLRGWNVVDSVAWQNEKAYLMVR